LADVALPSVVPISANVVSMKLFDAVRLAPRNDVVLGPVALA
jgi:hypothetical protein